MPNFFGEKVTIPSGVIKDAAGQPAGTFTVNPNYCNITVVGEITFDITWWESMLGGSYYDSGDPATAHTKYTFECIASNLDGCYKWKFTSCTRDNANNAWHVTATGTFEKV